TSSCWRVSELRALILARSTNSASCSTWLIKTSYECVYCWPVRKRLHPLLSICPAALPMGRMYYHGEQPSRRVCLRLRHTQGKIYRDTVCGASTRAIYTNSHSRCPAHTATLSARALFATRCFR